jgi:dolichol-phosphate mannosyltransferase
MIDISVVIPIKDEADNIDPLAQEVTAAMSAQSWEWECIWVDDGSSDQSLSRIKSVAAGSERHRYLVFEKNAGQSAALWAGFQASRGTYIAMLDGDRQNDPSDIGRLMDIITRSLNTAHEIHMVNGFRKKRQDSAIRKVASRVANGFRNLTTGKTVRDVGCSTRVFHRKCVAELPRFCGLHRFLPTLAAIQGFNIAEIEVNHRPRKSGETKYTINNRLWVGLYDIIGVMWLKNRNFNYKIIDK